MEASAGRKANVALKFMRIGNAKSVTYYLQFDPTNHIVAWRNDSAHAGRIMSSIHPSCGLSGLAWLCASPLSVIPRKDVVLVECCSVVDSFSTRSLISFNRSATPNYEIEHSEAHDLQSNIPPDVARHRL